ncbi:MAG: hypothetical protein HY908_21375 [Myxococcales bacterium]|nr:hypothetical protein [Myxococcales bacterium]
MSSARAVKGLAALGILALVLGSAACPGPEPAVRQTASGGAAGVAGAAGAGGEGGNCSIDLCPGVDTDCRMKTCYGDHLCSFANALEYQPCDDAPPDGKVCDGAGNCVECIDHLQCTSPETCDTNAHVCVSLHCTNQVVDEDETDLNCGGADCADCVNGKFCNAATDCLSAYCDTSAGGGQGGSGAAGVCAACSSDTECAGTEWCDLTIVGGTCVPKKADGEVCAGPGQCTSGFCPAQDGVCCDGACAAECMSCLAANTGQANGSCSSVTQGEDPDGECTVQGSEPCGANGTGCNGSVTIPGCWLYPDTTVCGTESCSGFAYVPPAECNGSGTCVPGNTTTCPNNLVCNAGGTACLTTCSVDGNCRSGFYCAAPNCAAKMADGASCGGDNECTNGHCVDGVCCNNACGGACDACTAALKGTGVDGVCGYMPFGAAGSPSCSPYVCAGISALCQWSCPGGDSSCVNTHYCNGLFACVPKLANGTACGGNNECEFGNCVDGVCCNSACGGLCQACTAALKGSGSDGTCGSIATGTDPGNECASGVCDGSSNVCVACVTDANCLGTEYCDGANTCQPKKANGAACGGNNQCTNGNCVDGFCCNTACGGACDRCNTVGSEGTCTILTGGAPGDPSCAPYVCWGGSTCPTLCPLGDVNCSTGNYCNGSNACVPKLADGVACGGDNQCANGHCVDGVCCNTACGGSCDACNLAPNVGTCTNVAAGQPGNPSCSPYECRGGATCSTSCNFDSECASTAYCDFGDNNCWPKRGVGGFCTRDAMCASGNCDVGQGECL